MKEYAVVFEKTATGYSAYCPDLPGLASCGTSFEEAQQMIREGLEFHIESMIEDDDVIPEATTRVLTIAPEVLQRQLAKSA